MISQKNSKFTTKPGFLLRVHVVFEWVFFSTLLLLEYIDEIVTGLHFESEAWGEIGWSEVNMHKSYYEYS